MHTTSSLRAPAWREAGKWLVGAVVGWICAIFLFFSTGWSVEDILSPSLGTQFGDMIAFSLGGAAGGTVLGVAAWVILQELAGSPGRWVLVSSAGFTLGTVVGFSIAAMRDNAVGALIGGAIIGLGLGMGQWRVLRHLPHAHWWVVANVLGVGAAFYCIFTLGGVGHETRALLSSSVAYALITAIPLVWMAQCGGHMTCADIRKN